MTFEPTTNRIPFGLLTEIERAELKAWRHGWEFYDAANGWEAIAKPYWRYQAVYRAKPAPVVKSTWSNIYKNFTGKPYSVPDFNERKDADAAARSHRIGVLRLDLIDGKLSVELEPLEDKP